VPTPTSNLYRFIDESIGGDLAQRIALLRADGMSFDAIAHVLRETCRAHVNGETIRRWAAQLESEAVA
jgi:hypothetical protein